MLLSIQPALVRFGPILVVIAAITLFYGAALGSPLTLHAMHTDDDVVWQFRTDTIEQFAYVQEHGYLPFWIDRRGLGQSAFVGSYHGSFYPLRWLALRLAPRAEEAADWLIWSQMLVAGLTTMALARHYGMSRWAAAFAGLCFALGHLPMRWAPFSHTPTHFATYPLAVLGTELIWSGRARHGLGLLALSLGISGLGAHLQYTHMALHVVGIIVLYRLLTTSLPRRVRLQRLGLSVAAVLLGIAIAAPVLVPFVWEQRGTTRDAVAEAGASGMSPYSLAAYVDPHSLYIGDDVYMGPLAPALMLVGLLVSLRRRRLALLPILVGLGLLIGFKTPLLDLLQQMVPGWSAVSNVRRLSFVMVPPTGANGRAGTGLVAYQPAEGADHCHRGHACRHQPDVLVAAHGRVGPVAESGSVARLDRDGTDRLPVAHILASHRCHRIGVRHRRHARLSFNLCDHRHARRHQSDGLAGLVAPHGRAGAAGAHPGAGVRAGRDHPQRLSVVQELSASPC